MQLTFSVCSSMKARRSHAEWLMDGTLGSKMIFLSWWVSNQHSRYQKHLCYERPLLWKWNCLYLSFFSRFSVDCGEVPRRSWSYPKCGWDSSDTTNLNSPFTMGLSLSGNWQEVGNGRSLGIIGLVALKVCVWFEYAVYKQLVFSHRSNTHLIYDPHKTTFDFPLMRVQS